MDRAPESRTTWTFLTNHARVLAAIFEDHTIRVRDIATRCQLTERAVQKIITDLEDGGYLTHIRQGRSNVYRIPPGTFLRHPADAGATVADLLSLLAHQETTHAAAFEAEAHEEHHGHRSDSGAH